MAEASARKRQTVLRSIDATRAAKAAVREGCEVEVIAPNGLRFLFRPLKEGPAAEPERNPPYRKPCKINEL